MSQVFVSGFGDVPFRTILVLAANPRDTSHLRLDKEVSQIRTRLRQTRYRDCFSLEQRWAVQYSEVQGALQGTHPQIVHFAGHGEGEHGLVFEDESGNSRFVNARALAKLFKLCASHVECVVLNACFSDVQAEAIAQHIPYVIGMRSAIGDTAARQFSVGFYGALGEKYSIEDAYEWGCNAIEIANIPEEQTPRLIKSTNGTLSSQPLQPPELLPEPSPPQQLPPPPEPPPEFPVNLVPDPKRRILFPSPVEPLWLRLTLGAIVVGGALALGTIVILRPPTSLPKVENGFTDVTTILQELYAESTLADVEVPAPPIGQKFSYAGSTVSAALLCKEDSVGEGGIHDQILKSHPKFQLQYISPSSGIPHSGNGIELLIEGKVDFVIASRLPKLDEERRVQGQDFELGRIRVAQYPLAVSVNHHVGINSNRGLTLKQLEGIFAGDITNWKSVGGVDEEVMPFVHIAEKSASFSFQKKVTRKFAPATEYVERTSVGIQKVANNPGGIYRAPAPLSFGQKLADENGQVLIQVIPIVNDRDETVFPYTNRSANPLDNCKQLSSMQTPPIYADLRYPDSLYEDMYVIFKDYPGNTNLQEKAGRAYANLLETNQGQEMLRYIGFLGFRQVH